MSVQASKNVDKQAAPVNVAAAKPAALTIKSGVKAGYVEIKHG